MPSTDCANPSPEGITSLLDTDLYKLTMQCAIMRSYPEVDCTYAFTNRTPDLKLTRRGFEWLETQVAKLSEIRLTDDEKAFLEKKCEFLPQAYVSYLSVFSFKPASQVVLSFLPVNEEEGEEYGDLNIEVKGKWVETILYEIPLLVLVSECFFRFSNTDWNYDGQEEKAFNKGVQLIENGCLFSEFGTRRRRSYHTQELVLKGLVRAQEAHKGSSGRLTGTSNVHFAHRFGLDPIGTVAHEWFMGIAAVTQSYTTANETGLREWVSCFGKGTLSIALTDTFGTPQFLSCFSKTCDIVDPPQTYAEIFAGVRQDSGDPAEFVKRMRTFYDSQGITDRKTVVFSDSLDVDKCIEYKQLASAEGFNVSFGVGTFLTNDFTHLSAAGKKSVPLNIVIKISSANGNPAIKISDNVGKNTGDALTVQRVKQELGYEEKSWSEGDEKFRWGGNA
ncbi:Quinolinate phosphoribosyl transferase [Geopyxis carbonaria]|nr:Quinolinate phosphoribosyl transferase [Geopyxis carbonaria]